MRNIKVIFILVIIGLIIYGIVQQEKANNYQQQVMELDQTVQELNLKINELERMVENQAKIAEKHLEFSAAKELEIKKMKSKK